MKINYAGCAICDSEWGNVWEEVEGERRFFCCALCAQQFRSLVAEIRRRTGWPTIDRLEVAGDRRGRTVRGAHGDERFECFVAFTTEGNVRAFEVRDSAPGPAVPPRERT